MTKIKDENEAVEGLTIDGGGGQRCLGDAGLHHDLEPMLLGEPLVPLLAGLGHPLAEGLADLRVDDVADVLPRHLADLPQHGEAVHDDLVGEPEVQDEVQRQVLVLGQSDVLDLVAEDGL